MEAVRYTALTAAEVDQFMTRIKTHIPMEQQRVPSSTEAALRGMRGLTFVPPTASELSSYLDGYTEWLAACEKALSDWHDIVNKQIARPRFRFLASNIGTRPGKDTVVTVEAHGDFLISPRRKKSEKANQLPPRPKPPQGKWRNALSWSIPAGLLEPDFSLSPLLSSSALHSLGQRDPNSFYFKPERPLRPVVAFSYECQQWRHS